MRNFAHFCLCLSGPQTPITQVCVSFPVSCSPCLSGEAIGQGRQDQRGKESKAGRPPSVRGTEGQEGVSHRGGCPSVDGAICLAVGEPCPALREPEESPPPRLFLQKNTAPTLLHSGLISLFTPDARLRCYSTGHVGGGRSAPPAAPPQAELKELIVRVAPRCLGWAPPTSPPHAAVGLCMV